MKKILVIITILIATAPTLFAQNDGDNFFGAVTIHEIQLTFTQTSFWDTLVSWKTYADATGDNVYIMADVTVDGMPYNSIGVRLKGNSSYSLYPGDKKPFKLKFNEYVSGQKIDGLKKLTLNNGLNDPTMLREKLILDYSRKHNVAAPRASYAKVYLNNVYWGLYSVVEQVDKTFLGNYFTENGGNLFKGDPLGRFKWEGNIDSNYYDNLELKTNETTNNWSDIVKFIDYINNTPSSNFEDSLNAVFNTSEFLRNNALNLLFVSLDSYVGIGHNYYVYHNLDTDKFEWITWDANGCFGVYNSGMSISQLENLSLLYIKAPTANLPLLVNIYNNTNLKLEYLNHVSSFLSADFDTTYLYGQIDSLANAIRSDLYADTKKMFSNTEFEDNIEYTVVSNGSKQIPPLKGFLAARIPTVISELATFGINVGIKEAETDGITFYPNPTTGAIQIDLIKNHSNINVKVYNLAGQLQSNSNYSNLSKVNVTLPKNKGMFLIKVLIDDSLSIIKVIKK